MIREHVIRTIKTYINIIYNNKIGKYVWKKPKIESIDETLDYIYENKCSVSRFGDGEFAIISGNSNGFQKRDEELGIRLAEILKNPIEDHIVCLPDIFGDMKDLKNSSREFNNGLLGKERRKWLKLIDLNRTYYNTFFTRCYNMFEDKSNAIGWFEKNKKIWIDQDILIIEGKYSRLGVGNDLFQEAKSIQRILAPAQNAYDQYDALLNEAQEYGGGKLILLALGMTATVLAYDLAKLGFWAIDIGHIDVEYEWYKLGVKDKVALKGKYVNEVVGGGENISDDVSEEYWKQIIKIVGE